MNGDKEDRGISEVNSAATRGGMFGLFGALLALLGLSWADHYFDSLSPRLWIILVAALGAVSMMAVCGVVAHRDRVSARHDAMWNLEVGRLSGRVQDVADEIHDLQAQLTHPDGTLRLALKAELGALAKQRHESGCQGCAAEITELKKTVQSLEALVVPETVFYLRGFMDGQSGEGEPDAGSSR